MSTVGRLITAEELLRMPDDSHRYDLIGGQLIKMSPAGSQHGRIAMKAGSRLDRHVESNHLGIVVTAETGFILSRNPDTVLAPDVAFVSRARIPPEGIPEGFWPGAPDLAVEVVSPNDTSNQVTAKVHEYLRAGTRMVWVLHPRLQTVTVYRSLNDINILQEEDTLDGQDVVPGFRLPVASLFD